MEFPPQEIAIVRELTTEELDKLLITKSMFIKPDLWDLIQKYTSKEGCSHEDFINHACKFYMTFLAEDKKDSHAKTKPMKIKKKHKHHWYGDLPESDDEDVPLIDEELSLAPEHLSFLDALKRGKKYNSY